MSISGIQGLPIEITVVGCYNLADKEWISRQDPYVCLEYGTIKYRTKTCTDGGKNPTFQEKFVFPLIEGLRELNVVVWNSNTLSRDDFIGSGRIQLHKALTQGFDDATWPLQSKTGRHSGEVRLILHYASANQSKKKLSEQQYVTPSSSMSHFLPHQQAPPTSYPPTTAYTTPSPYSAYPPQPATYPPSSYPPQPASYPPSSYHSQPATYPPSSYPPMAPAPPTGYPPQSHTYPPQPYTYPSTAYPPPSQAPAYHPPGPPSGIYPPPY